MAQVTLNNLNNLDSFMLNGATYAAIINHAYGTLTFASAVANDTFVVAGVTFTIYGDGDALNAAQNPAGLLLQATDTLQAAAAMDAVNKHPVSGALVRCTYLAGVLHVKAVANGTAGNAYTLVGGDRITASGATLTDASALSANQYAGHFGEAVTATKNAKGAEALAAVLVAAGYVVTRADAVLQIYNADGSEPLISTNQAARLPIKTRHWVSAEQTGTGSAQNVAHDLFGAPRKVVVALTEVDGNAVDVAEGTHTSTNVVLTVTSGAKFKVEAWY